MFITPVALIAIYLGGLIAIRLHCKAKMREVLARLATEQAERAWQSEFALILAESRTRESSLLDSSTS